MANCKDCLFYIPCLDNHKDESLCSNFEHKKDFVKVVRCKDCKRYMKVGEFSSMCVRTMGMSYAKPDDFCSYGERREGE